MNEYKCFDCGYSWFLSNGNNGHAVGHACPKCGSDKVQHMVDSLVHDLHAGATIADPSILSIPYGQGKGFRFQKWMTN